MSNGKVSIYACEQGDHSSEAIGAWFLGPKAENHPFMRDAFGRIVDHLEEARKAYKPGDPEYITKEVMNSQGYQDAMKKTLCLLDELSKYMSKHNIPFYSPRYAAHMTGDTTFPAILGYLLGMLYNPNNVTAEASPLTTLIEYEVGQDLCKMLGYPGNDATGKELKPWGHITCDGSVANLESMWAARNLKFYPLSLKNAMAPGGPLHRIAASFQVPLCTGEPKHFAKCSAWELLNLTPDTVNSLEERVIREYRFSKEYYQKVMSDYIIQTTSKDSLLSQYEVEPPQYFVATTKHYSWPKGAAITGIGSENMIEVRVDNNARMDPVHLEQLLEDRLQRKQAVYAVVAIVGSTEHGSVDPLDQIVYLREKFQKKGLSFMIHADAAWGGYFASLLRDVPRQSPFGKTPEYDPFVIKMCLLDHTKKQLESLKYADSITIDPHKSGYIPYPAGSLCYRDTRMTSLVTWSTPYIDYEGADAPTMGIYGLEGSKPGAAPVAVWLSHAAIGLHKGGYGSLLGQAMFTGVRMYCRWATMSTQTSDLIVVPLNTLPSEQKLHPTTEEVEAEKDFIREHILDRSNREISEDKEALEKVQALGSDLMINAFACNFRVDGVANTSVTEANILNAEIYEALSVYHVSGDVKKRDLFLMSTVLSQKQYGDCLTNFKRRLGLRGDEDLFVLSNVCMSPFPTARDFDEELANVARETAEEVVAKICIPRNRMAKATHSFLMQGTDDEIHLVYIPALQMAPYRQQLIMTVKLPAAAAKAYTSAQEQNSMAIFCLHTAKEVLLSDILRDKSFHARIEKRIPEEKKPLGTCGKHLFEEAVEVEILRIVAHRSLDPHLLDSSYPKQMSFYLYGTKQQHIDHIFLSAPNTQLSASNIKLEFAKEQVPSDLELKDALERGLIAVFDEVSEAEMQPFNEGNPPSFFAPGEKFAVTIRRGDPNPGIQGTVFARGTITLRSNVFRDFITPNKNLFEILRDNSIPPEEIKELRKFIQGKAVPCEGGETNGPKGSVANGGRLILDRFQAKNQQEDDIQSVPQISAFRAPWRLNV